MNLLGIVLGVLFIFLWAGGMCGKGLRWADPMTMRQAKEYLRKYLVPNKNLAIYEIVPVEIVEK